MTGAEKILHAITDVDDEYVTDAITFAEKNHSVTRFRKTVISIVAAAACFTLIMVSTRIIGTNNISKPGTDSSSSQNSGEMSALPPQQVNSLAEAEKTAGFKMSVPKAKTPYSHQVFTVSDSTIEVDYETEDESDTGYYIGKAKGSRDISGDYNKYSYKDSVTVDGTEITVKGKAKDSLSLATWTKDGYSYCIGAQNHPMTEEKMISLIKETD